MLSEIKHKRAMELYTRQEKITLFDDQLYFAGWHFNGIFIL